MKETFHPLNINHNLWYVFNISKSFVDWYVQIMDYPMLFTILDDSLFQNLIKFTSQRDTYIFTLLFILCNVANVFCGGVGCHILVKNIYNILKMDNRRIKFD